MTCSYCGSRNQDGEHRCWRCGRRPGDSLNVGLTHGALATKPMAPAPIREFPEPGRPLEVPRAAPSFSRAVQTTLFPEKAASNVIPIADYAAIPAEPQPRSRPRIENADRPARPPRRAAQAPEAQGRLEFLPSAPGEPRKLGTTVDAVIHCEAPVATPLHRTVAAAFDWSMVLIGYGLFVATFLLNGGGFAWNKLNLLVFGGALLLIAFTYGIFWALAGCETAGMRWAHLRLTTFDGFPPEPKQRLARLASSCLSLCTVLGVLWILADEESLGWPDHISGTFPTPRESDSQVFHRR